MSEEKTTSETPDQEVIAAEERRAAEIKANIDSQLEKQKDVFRKRFLFLREFMAKCNGVRESLRPSADTKRSYGFAVASDRLTEARMWTARLHDIVLKRCHFPDVVSEEEKTPLDRHATIDFVVGDSDFSTKINDEINNLVSMIQSEQPITNDSFESWIGTYLIERLMETQMWLQED